LRTDWQEKMSEKDLAENLSKANKLKQDYPIVILSCYGVVLTL